MAGPAHHFTMRLFFPENYTREEVSEDTLWVSRSNSQFLHTAAALRRMIRPDEGVFFAPYLPALYVLVGRPSPVRELAFFAPRTETTQADLVATLKQRNVAWVILGDFALDGQEQYRMRYSHSLVWQYLMENFCELRSIELPKAYRLMHRCRAGKRRSGVGEELFNARHYQRSIEARYDRSAAPLDEDSSAGWLAERPSRGAQRGTRWK